MRQADTDSTTLPRRPEDLLKRLLEAQTEQQVHLCLSDAGLLDDGCWRPYGGRSNNSGSFLNQQASARGALVEKVINSIDAVLMARAFERGDIPSGRAPASMFEAAARYFDIPSGRLAKIDQRQRAAIARDAVQVVLSGNRTSGRPTVTITDQGEGQSPASFPQTFLSLLASNKAPFPFVQGKFNMGSTGAVPFCGPDHNYQLIVSRRHRSAPGSDRRWGFTIVRRRYQGRTSEFQYLAPGGEVPTFEADAVPIWVEGDLGRAERESGTLVRLYEYDIKERTAANLDFRRMLDRRLYRIALPVQIVESRPFPTAPSDAIVAGLGTAFEEDDSGEVEPRFPAPARIRVAGVGWVTITLIPLREGVPVDRWTTAGESIIFTVNGQAHAFEGRDFIRRRSSGGFRFLAQSLLVEVDCSELDQRTLDDLFMGSRDRMRQNDQRTALLGALADHLQHHKGLRRLNDERREAAIRKSTASRPETSELFTKMIKASPAIAALLSGGTIPAPKLRPPPLEPFSGRRFPTHLQWKKGGPVQEKRCRIDSFCTLELETDAENDFLSRAVDPGILVIEPDSWVVREQLWDGNLRIRLEPPPDAKVGDVVPLAVTLMSDSPPEIPAELRAEGRVLVEAQAVTPGPPQPPAQRRGVGPPEIREVRRDEWPAYEFSARSVAMVEKTDDKTIVFINMDGEGFLSYLRAEPRRKVELEQMYKVAVAPLALSLRRAVDSSDITFEEADKTLSAVGDVLLPAVDFAARVADVE